MKWKKPTRCWMPRHEASTASRPRANVSTSMITVRPSSARKKLMPSCEIQVACRCASQAPCTRPAAPGPCAANAACSALACLAHCQAISTSGAAVPATATQRAACGRERDTSQASGAAAAGMMMYQRRIIPASPQHHEGDDDGQADTGHADVDAQLAVL